VYRKHSPALGTGLNRPAHITLYGVYPKRVDGSRGPTEDTMLIDKFRSNLERRAGCTLLEYEPVAGMWRFAVDHFSRCVTLLHSYDLFIIDWSF
jgi:hypothetical protein